MSFLRKKNFHPPPRTRHSWIAVIHKSFPVEIDQVADTATESPLFIVTQAPPVRHHVHGMEELNGLLVSGLQVLAVNDESICNYTLPQARAFLAQASFPLRLRVYGVYVRGNRWMNPTLSEHQALGLKLDLSMGRVRVGQISARTGRFRGDARLQVGMLLTNLNGLEVSTASSKLFNPSKDGDTRRIRQRLYRRLLTPPTAPPPNIVALDISSSFQASLINELEISIPESDLPLCLQSTTFKLKRFTSSPQPPTRSVSLPGLTPNDSTFSSTNGPIPSIKARDMVDHDENGDVPSPFRSISYTPVSQSAAAFESHSTSTTTVSIPNEIANTIDMTNVESALSDSYYSRRGGNKFDKMDKRLENPVFDEDDEDESVSFQQPRQILDDDDDKNALVHVPQPSNINTNVDADNHGAENSSHPLNDDPKDLEHSEAFMNHNDGVLRMYGSHRSLRSGQVIHPCGNSAGHISAQTESTNSISSRRFVDDGVNGEPGDDEGGIGAIIDGHPFPIISKTVTSSPDLAVLSAHYDSNVLTIHFEKNDTTPRLGLILRQDLESHDSGVVIHGVLKGGLFGEGTPLKAGQVIQMIQGRPCPTSTSETFDLLTRLTGRFSMQVRIPEEQGP
jgi:hypothetical protein